MQYVVFALGVLCCAGALYLNQRDRRDYARVQAEAVSRGDVPQLEEIQLLVADLSAQLNQTADKIVSDLETRANLLKELVEEARSLAAALESSTPQQREKSEALKNITILPWDGPGPTISLPSEIGGVGPQQRPETGRNAPRPVAPSSWRDREAAIHEMAGRGLDVLTIAKELNIGKGEVKLILDLKKANAR